MTNILVHDAVHKKQESQPLLPFSGGDLDRSGIRLTRAEFSRFLGVSKQAVTDWVKSGKVVLGVDDRLDPRQAVSQLLRSGDPARLRSKVLAPLMKDVGALQQRIANLERDLARALENVDFYRISSLELIDIAKAFEIRLRMEWLVLREIDADTALAAIAAWLRKTEMHLVNPALKIIGSDETGDLDWMGLDSETAAEIESAAAEYNQLDSEARAAAEMGAGAKITLSTHEEIANLYVIDAKEMNDE